MRIRAVLLAITTFALVIGPLSTTWAKPAGQGAFLIEYAETVQQVASQVEDSRLIALRYAKHFRTDPSTVLMYFRNELSVSKLDDAASLVVYYLDASHNIVSEAKQFKAGTRVFANKAGVPMLEWGTGNPLAATLLLGARTLAETLASAKPGETGPPNGVAVQVLEQPPTELPPAVTPSTPAPGAAPLTPGEAPTVATISGPGLPPPAPAPTGKGSGLGSASSWLLPVGLAGVAALAGGGGNGDGGLEPPPPNGGGNEPVVPVPEPASLLTLAAGILALGGRTAYGRRGCRRHE